MTRFKDEYSTTPQRSKLMSKIKGKDTKPEIRLRKKLWSLGVRYRKNYKKLEGSPDIYIPGAKLAIFVDGEFWHGYQWQDKRKRIKSNREYWIPKIERNIARDHGNNQKLAYQGITVLRFWEREVMKDLEKCVEAIMEKLNGG